LGDCPIATNIPSTETVLKVSVLTSLSAICATLPCPSMLLTTLFHMGVTVLALSLS